MRQTILVNDHFFLAGFGGFGAGVFFFAGDLLGLALNSSLLTFTDSTESTASVLLSFRTAVFTARLTCFLVVGFLEGIERNGSTTSWQTQEQIRR
jgi:hypothetical protein